MSKEMKERLRKEYVGFGGAENKVRARSVCRQRARSAAAHTTLLGVRCAAD